MYTSTNTTHGNEDDRRQRGGVRAAEGPEAEDESFPDLVTRLLDETTTDWREGFGTLDEDGADELEQLVADSRKRASSGLSARQEEALEALSDGDEDDDETA